MHYDGKDIPDPPTHPEFADAIYHWNPVISPSGISLLYRRCHPGLEGQPPHRRAVVQAIVRLTLDGEKVTGRSEFPWAPVSATSCKAPMARSTP